MSSSAAATQAVLSPTLDNEAKFIATLLDAIRHKKLDLPSMPDVLIKVRRMSNDPKITAQKIANIVGADPALSARLLQVANGPLHRRRKPTLDLSTAVIQLGYALVLNLLTSLAMAQMYRPNVHPIVANQLRELWEHAAYVAALSHVFSKRFTRLSPDQAMLAGLIHDIGKLPILTRMEIFPELLNSPSIVKRLVKLLHPQVGRAMLEAWNFPPELVAVALEHENIERIGSSSPDYVDVVIAANLHSHSLRGEPFPIERWEQVPAFAKLGLTPDNIFDCLSNAQEEIAEIRALLSK